ncbi:hypothetical protein MLD38_027540 [Melastoma candidum]|uniref:Uncharacterized protein n=1 Tax=Melastoma candidum TaxID=119954 RepID=A0ACB9P5A2_9MYRT|nr:hypothetical protein MLD38_027540 [Melastoma candidum]
MYFVSEVMLEHQGRVLGLHDHDPTGTYNYKSPQPLAFFPPRRFFVLEPQTDNRSSSRGFLCEKRIFTGLVELMALDQYFAQEWKSIPGKTVDSGNSSGCFDCNICLDFASEPVVTLCGHLYCWPCIYKWLHVQSASLASDEYPQCPVCKAEISYSAMVPLYGRGQNPKDAKILGEKASVIIPPRPAACGIRALASAMQPSGQQLAYRNPYQNNPHFGGPPYEVHADETMPSPLSMSGLHHSTVGIFGEMFIARVFGNSESVYGYPNSYRRMAGGGGSSSSRGRRRQEQLAEESLSRISFFLFCCFLLCLIVF